MRRIEPTAAVLLFILALVALIGIIALAVVEKKAPDVLETVLLMSVGGAAGAGVPGRRTTTAPPGP
jgi:hypothetical protein